MLLSGICFLLWIGFGTAAIRMRSQEIPFPLRWGNFVSFLREFPSHTRSLPHLLFFASFVFFLFLPLLLGLAFLLKTDANVLVVVFWIVWIYNWTKYLYFSE